LGQRSRYDPPCVGTRITRSAGLPQRYQAAQAVLAPRKAPTSPERAQSGWAPVHPEVASLTLTVSRQVPIETRRCDRLVGDWTPTNHPVALAVVSTPVEPGAHLDLGEPTTLRRRDELASGAVTQTPDPCGSSRRSATTSRLSAAGSGPQEDAIRRMEVCRHLDMAQVDPRAGTGPSRSGQLDPQLFRGQRDRPVSVPQRSSKKSRHKRVPSSTEQRVKPVSMA
jgi:hypothetical protein